MVFIVITHIEGDGIEYSIITEGLLLFIMGKIVFLYPPGSQGMEAYREEEAGQEIDEGLRAKKIPDAGREGDLSQPVQGNPFVEGLDLPEAGDAEYLEEGIEQQPNNFSDEIVIDESGFPAIGQIGIQFMYSLERMMFDMVAFEGYAAGEYLGQVGQDPSQAIGCSAFEQEVMCTFMDHDKQRMICKGAQQVGCAEYEPPGLSAYQPGQGYLKGYESNDREDGILVLANEIPDFRMFFKNLSGTKTVGFLFSGIDEICFP
jgi:hypothetical protein